MLVQSASESVLTVPLVFVRVLAEAEWEYASRGSNARKTDSPQVPHLSRPHYPPHPCICIDALTLLPSLPLRLLYVRLVCGVRCAVCGRQGAYLYPWGNKLLPKGQHRTNIFQGTFPGTNLIEVRARVCLCMYVCVCVLENRRARIWK